MAEKVKDAAVKAGGSAAEMAKEAVANGVGAKAAGVIKENTATAAKAVVSAMAS